MLAVPDLNGLETALRFFEAIYDKHDLILLRRIASWKEGGDARTETNYKATRYVRCDREALLAELRRELLESAELGENCYFGVCPRFGGEGQFDMAWQIRTIRVLWADLDKCSVEEALKRVADKGLPAPSIVVNSGNGVHLYWLLDQPYLIDDVEDPPATHNEWRDTPEGKRKPHKYILQDGEMLFLEEQRHLKRLSQKALQFQAVLAGIADKIGGDHTKDVSRLLRIPGSMNRKDVRNGAEPKATELVGCDPTRRYSIEQFLPFAKKCKDAEREANIEKMPLPMPVKLRGKKQDVFNRLVAGCEVAPKGKRSQADFALCCYAIKHGIADLEVWSRVKGIGKFAESGNRYFELTWANAQYVARCEIYDELHAVPRDKLAPPPLDLDEEEEPAQDLAAEPSTPPSSVPRTTIVIHEATLVSTTMRQITDRLLAGGCFYTRAEQLVAIRNEKIRPVLTPQELAGQMNSLAEFLYYEKTIGRYKPLSTVLASTWLTHPFEIARLKPIKLFSHNPVYTEDWRLLAPGYDAATGIYYAGQPIQPREGRHYLDRLLYDFCFTTPGDRTNYIGMLLTALLVPHFIGSKPALLLNGTQPGLGKSVLSQIIAILRDGQPVETATFNSNDEEFEKRLGVIVRRGATTIVLDNAKSSRGGRRIESPCLERSITDAILSFRLLGQSASIQTENSHIFCITANAPEVSADLVSRSLIVNLKHNGDPRRRKFTISNPEEFALVHRQEILAELCGMIELWKSARMPLADVNTRFNKRNWGNIIGGILHTNSEPDFLDNYEETAAQLDETRRDFEELMADLAAAEQGNWTADELVHRCESLNILRDDIGDRSKRSKQIKFGLVASRYINEAFTTPSGIATFRRTEERNGSLYSVALAD